MMEQEIRDLIEPIFNSLNPHKARLHEFPSRGDDGGGNGDDVDLARIIVYGATSELDERQVEFAIRLGRALEREGISL